MTPLSQLSSQFAAALADKGYAPLDVLVLGATGAGKSSTVNAVCKLAGFKVGHGMDPQTKEFQVLAWRDLLQLWDSPGLGDCQEKDALFASRTQELLMGSYHLNTLKGVQLGCIDAVLVIVDLSTRDLGTIIGLLNNVISPCFPKERVLFAYNKCDMALNRGRWDEARNQPTIELEQAMWEKKASFDGRIEVSTGFKPRSVIYSAEKGFNLYALVAHLVEHLPPRRRFDALASRQVGSKKLSAHRKARVIA